MDFQFLYFALGLIVLVPMTKKAFEAFREGFRTNPKNAQIQLACIGAFFVLVPVWVMSTLWMLKYGLYGLVAFLVGFMMFVGLLMWIGIPWVNRNFSLVDKQGESDAIDP